MTERGYSAHSLPKFISAPFCGIILTYQSLTSYLYCCSCIGRCLPEGAGNKLCAHGISGLVSHNSAVRKELNAPLRIRRTRFRKAHIVIVEQINGILHVILYLIAEIVVILKLVKEFGRFEESHRPAVATQDYARKNNVPIVYINI